MKLYKKCTIELYPFLVSDTTSPADNILHFRHNRIESI